MGRGKAQKTLDLIEVARLSLRILFEVGADESVYKFAHGRSDSRGNPWRKDPP